MHSHGADAASKIFPQIVLILVVMEDALAHIKNKDMEKLKMVLILVVMEDALAPQNLGYALFKRIVRLDCAS